MKKQSILLYPPGGLLIWIVVFLELVTFAIGLGLMNYFEKMEPVVFLESRKMLNATLGTINTTILLISGYFMAYGIQLLKSHNQRKASQNISISVFLGVLFLLIKAFEYYQKIGVGIGLSTNTFFTFYFLLTAFHAIHVLFGISLFAYFLKTIKTDKYNLEDVEASGIFWHLCDLIWLLLFPLMYFK